ncbi:hypothetical protein [Sinisalibacter aestuarii]|uniref:Peptidase M41 domain-containing protein n=1 Tax=Sinisalibacter aestuarii TaxID=2949426 RepID=A0ABQ5LT50_9RHOB|nr:hypothetical protein [Sinisalibacter aestuarii]GKY87501.1 hypothetical protein STA1M1_13700 [Sinisalibacter aestuarii]
MYEENCPIPEGRCADLGYRLAVYEAGHALTARAMGFEILSVTMLPRPPVLESDKVLHGNSLTALASVLENRCIELFGGQIAEQHACASASCCTGDVARIDELTRLIAGIEGDRSAEEIWFELEDVAERVFADQRIRDAILPLAEFLYGEVEAGRPVVPGAQVEAMLDDLVGPRPDRSRKGLRRFLSRTRA